MTLADELETLSPGAQNTVAAPWAETDEDEIEDDLEEQPILADTLSFIGESGGALGLGVISLVVAGATFVHLNWILVGLIVCAAFFVVAIAVKGELLRGPAGTSRAKLPAQSCAMVDLPGRSIGSADMSIADELAKLKSLHDEGALSSEEFDAAKAKLLAHRTEAAREHPGRWAGSILDVIGGATTSVALGVTGIVAAGAAVIVFDALIVALFIGLIFIALIGALASGISDWF